jgi:hypothetical protein
MNTTAPAQGRTQVGEGIREGRVDLNRLLVVRDGLLQLALLLEHAAQVAVRRGELGHQADGGHVAVDGLLDEAFVDHSVACDGNLI